MLRLTRPREQAKPCVPLENSRYRASQMPTGRTIPLFAIANLVITNPKMMRFFAVWTVGLVAVGSVLLGGCGSSARAPERTEPSVLPAPSVPDAADEAAVARPTSDAVQQLVEAALQGRQPTTYEAVVRRLGPPQRVTAQAVENTYAAGQVDTVRTLYYPALQARVYVRSDDAHSFLIQLQLLASFYADPNGLRVDMARQAVRQQLGAPQRVENGTWVYENVEQGTADLRLSWNGERLQAITYVFHFS